MSTTLTHSGRLVDLLQITPDDINLNDISWALSSICRFMGHTRRHYSVAEHSINVARLLPEPIKIYGLLHDAHEAYIGDISTPVKLALKRSVNEELVEEGIDNVGGRGGIFESALESIERPIIAAIHKKLGVPWPVSPHVAAAVKYADVTMGQYEMQQLFYGPQVPKPELPMPRWRIDADEPINVAYQFQMLVERYVDDLRAAA